MKTTLLALLYALRTLFRPVCRFREVAVLAYHSVSSGPEDTTVAPAAFAAHLDALARSGYAFVRLSDVVAWREGRADLPPRAVALTFDDGYADFVTAALPCIRRHAAPVTLFLVGDRGAYQRRQGVPMLGDAVLARLREDPLVELGYHTQSHPDLRTLTPAELRAECAAPFPARYFAYPGGNYSTEARDAVAALGYEAAFSIKPDLVRRSHDPYLLPRIVITREMTERGVLMRASVAVTWYRTLRRLRYG